jgi:hypothetical protein
MNETQLDRSYAECKKLIDEAKETAAKLDMISKDPEFYIYEQFQEIKNKVDLRREELKAQIDQYSDELIRSIESTRIYCISLLNQINNHANELESYKNQLYQLVTSFDVCNNEEIKWEYFKNDADFLRSKFIELLSVYKKSLSANKEYSFVYDVKPISDIFGKVIDYQIVNKI